MKFYRCLSISLALTIAGTAYAGERVFEFAPRTGQTIEFADGQQVAIAEGKVAIVKMIFVPESSGSGWLNVSVQNLGTEALTVQESSLVATSGETPLRTYSYEDMMKAQKRKEGWRKAAAAFAAGANGYAAGSQGTSHTNGSYSGTSTATAYGSGGSATANGRHSGTYSSTTYDPAAQAAATDRANKKNADMKSELEASKNLERAALDERVLRANTVRPGEVVTGQIRIDLPKSSKAGAALDIALNAGPETLYFSLVERR